jgi:TIR domain
VVASVAGCGDPAGFDRRLCLEHHGVVSEWAAFFSYAHHDDRAEGGRLHKLAEALATEVQSQTGQPFEIFVDRDAIHWGTNWKRALDEGLQQSTFLIPVITPSYFESEYCRNELAAFLAKEKALGRDDLVFPIHYIEVGLFDDKSLRSRNRLARALHRHQYVDWRHLRHVSLSAVGVRTEISKMAARLRTSMTEEAAPRRTIRAADASRPRTVKRRGEAPTATKKTKDLVAQEKEREARLRDEREARLRDERLARGAAEREAWKASEAHRLDEEWPALLQEWEARHEKPNARHEKPMEKRWPFRVRPHREK